MKISRPFVSFLIVHQTSFLPSRTSNNSLVTPPQSGSGRKEQTKSKADKEAAHSFAQRVQLFYRKTSNGRSRAQPLRSLGVPKGPFSTVENGPLICTPLSRRLACARWARVLLVLVRCHGDVQLVELLLRDLARRAPPKTDAAVLGALTHHNARRK